MCQVDHQLLFPVESVQIVPYTSKACTILAIQKWLTGYIIDAVGNVDTDGTRDAKSSFMQHEMYGNLDGSER